MKRLLLVLFCAANVSLSAQSTQTVSMGAGYANDVFYSFANGIVKTEPRGNWHIAFTTQIVDASIWINEGLGVELYEGSSNVSDWSTFDTTGMTWTNLYNSPNAWEEGAFNALATGHPDYGWGDYNNITHNVSGSSIFVLKLPNGDYKKMIIDAMKTNGDYELRVANLDGSGLLSKVFSKTAYSTKNFFYWDVLADSIIDREPATTDWDILFTRYMEEVIPGTYYPVGGAYINKGVMAAKAEGIDTNTVDWNNYPRTDSITTIGSNWKSFDNGTFQWNITDSLAYFVEAQDGNLYKLIFKDFGGSSSGDITFSTVVASAIGVAEWNSEAALEVYPQPANSWLEINAPDQSEIEIYNLTGALIYSEISQSATRIDVQSWVSGIYVLRVTTNGKVSATRIVIQ